MLGPWKPIIDAWLEADRLAPAKQRHTARWVWQRLVEEHGAEIGEGTVRRYVSGVRAGQPVAAAEVFVPQHHRLGEEAEADFGTIHVYLAGALMEVQLFVMRLSASGRSFAARLPRFIRRRARTRKSGLTREQPLRQAGL